MDSNKKKQTKHVKAPINLLDFDLLSLTRTFYDSKVGKISTVRVGHFSTVYDGLFSTVYYSRNIFDPLIYQSRNIFDTFIDKVGIFSTHSLTKSEYLRHTFLLRSYQFNRFWHRRNSVLYFIVNTKAERHCFIHILVVYMN